MQRHRSWRKAAFSAVALVATLLPAYIAGEVGYRSLHGIPVLPVRHGIDPDRRALSGQDTSAMDFGSVYYYEIFRESANPVLFYEPRPGFARGAVRINSHGFRDREFTPAKPSGTMRIVVLGDSVIWGHGIVVEDTFAKQLESLLAEHFVGRFEVLNFGVSGYSLQQEIELFFERARHFDPDIVILGTSVNDLQYSSLEGDFFRGQASGILQKSYLADALAASTSYLLTRYLDVPPRYLERVVDVEFHLARAKRAAPHVGWMVLMFPLLENFQNYDLQWYHDAVIHPARELGFVVRDLRYDFQRFPEAELGIDHIHPSRFGNQIAAYAALDTLRSSGLLRVVPRSARAAGR